MFGSDGIVFYLSVSIRPLRRQWHPVFLVPEALDGIIRKTAPRIRYCLKDFNSIYTIAILICFLAYRSGFSGDAWFHAALPIYLGGFLLIRVNRNR